MTRDLLANATPRPWTHRTGPDDDWGIVHLPDGRSLEPSHDVSAARHDSALIVAAVNEYETLLDLADALDALVRLDKGLNFTRARTVEYGAERDEVEMVVDMDAHSRCINALARLDALRGAS